MSFGHLFNIQQIFTESLLCAIVNSVFNHIALKSISQEELTLSRSPWELPVRPLGGYGSAIIRQTTAEHKVLMRGIG
jgi:hypothetical protein